MEVKVKLFSILKECLPPDAKRGEVNITLSDEATLVDLITHLGIDTWLGYDALDVPGKAGWQVVVSGKYESDMTRKLQDGETVLIFPPIAGG